MKKLLMIKINSNDIDMIEWNKKAKSKAVHAVFS